MTLRPDGAYRIPPMATAIIINSCSRVIFLSDTIKNLIQLRVVELQNVPYVIINERSLEWSPSNVDLENSPGIRITIHNSTVNEMASHAIRGRVDNIHISNSRLNIIKPFAFSSLTGVSNIELSDNDFININIQAFKKFTTTNFILRGGSIKSLPSRFLSDVEVTNRLQIEGVSVQHVSSLAFLVSMPQRVLIDSNVIGILESDAFNITTTGPITFRNNTVTTVRRGAFFGISALPKVTTIKGPQELLIDNNTMQEVTPDSLMYNRNSLTLRVDGLNLNVSCSCDLASQWHDMLRESGNINCWYSLEGYFISLPTYVDSRCGVFKQTFWIVVVVSILVLFFIIAIVIFFIVRRENEKRKKVQIVLPDSKTYRETEFHIVVERADLLTTDM